MAGCWRPRRSPSTSAERAPLRRCPRRHRATRGRSRPGQAIRPDTASSADTATVSAPRGSSPGRGSSWSADRRVERDGVGREPRRRGRVARVEGGLRPVERQRRSFRSDRPAHREAPTASAPAPSTSDLRRNAAVARPSTVSPIRVAGPPAFASSQAIGNANTNRAAGMFTNRSNSWWTRSTRRPGWRRPPTAGPRGLPPRMAGQTSRTTTTRATRPATIPSSPSSAAVCMTHVVRVGDVEVDLARVVWRIRSGAHIPGPTPVNGASTNIRIAADQYEIRPPSLPNRPARPSSGRTPRGRRSTAMPTTTRPSRPGDSLGTPTPPERARAAINPWRRRRRGDRQARPRRLECPTR